MTSQKVRLDASFFSSRFDSVGLGRLKWIYHAR
jgi:hypothetical protein